MAYEREIIKLIEDDRPRAAADFARVSKRIEEHNLAFHNGYIQTLAVPKLLTAERYDEIRAFIQMVYRIFDKVIAKYLDDPGYRSLFGFPPALEELILLASGATRRSGFVPMARIDFFLNEDTGDIGMCEINTDGTSAMIEDRLLGMFLTENSAFLRFIGESSYQLFELFDSWVTEFLAYYQAERPNASTLPNVAIIDFLDCGYLTEFAEFQKAFARQGINCEICDIRELAFGEDRRLRTPSGMAVDAIYRRAVTADIMARFDEVQPLINAVKDNRVCLVGGFATQIVHSKRFFTVLGDEATAETLSDEEYDFAQKHFPATCALTPAIINRFDVIGSRESWIIKPEDSYGARGFYAGKLLSDDNWAEVLSQCQDKGYVLQRYHQPYKTPNIDFAEGLDAPVRMYSNLTGVYCYNGKPYGIYSRLSQVDIISRLFDEKDVPTVLVAQE